MASRTHDLTLVQLNWCRQNMPSFAKANADVLRRDADVAANWAHFHRGPLPEIDNRLFGDVMMQQSPEVHRQFRIVG